MANESKSGGHAWIPGLLMILVGVSILLVKFDFIEFGWHQLYPILSLCFGALLFILCISRRDKGIVFPGTLFLSLGIYFFLRNYGFIRFYDFDRIWPVFLVALGLSFVALFIAYPRDWGVMVPGSLFLFFGITLLIDTIGKYWWWHELAANYWALIIVCIGLSILVSSLFRKKQEPS